MVSKFGHCLNDLLYRWQRRQRSAVEIAGVVSNHPDLGAMADAAACRSSTCR